MWENDELGIMPVEKVTRVAELHNSTSPNQESIDDRNAFKNILSKAMSKDRVQSTGEVTVSDPYLLDVTRMTHSLFYNTNNVVKLNIPKLNPAYL